MREEPAQNNLPAHINLLEKFGLHHGHFGELPTREAYLQLKSTLKRSNHLYSFDIQPEIACLSKNPQSTLWITVPTLGFTCPDSDYTLAPCFAIPLSINGFVANEKSASLSRAHIVVTDIGYGQYALYFDDAGNIDYTKIEKHHSGEFLYTPLSEISFIYTSEQILLGKQFHLIENEIQTKNVIEMLLPRGVVPFKIMLKVVGQNQTVLNERTLDYVPVDGLLHGHLSATWTGTSKKGLLKIHYKTTRSQVLHHAQCRLEIEIPMQADLQYKLNEKADWKSNDKTLKLTQYYGISKTLSQKLIKSIVPENLFEQVLLTHIDKESKESIYNRYDERQYMISVLYEELVQGVMNHSVPLFALGCYFASKEIILQRLEKISIQPLTKHDQFMFNTLHHLLKENVLSKEQWIDHVDELLSLQNQPIESTLLVETQGGSLTRENIGATLYINRENGKVNILPSTTMILGALISSAPRDEQSETPGNTYQIELPSQGNAGVIENFNWQANDKINLTELLKALDDKKGGSSVVYTKLNQQGDTQIWVEHHSPQHEVTTYHVATLKGVSAQTGSLPHDVSAFIELRRS